MRGILKKLFATSLIFSTVIVASCFGGANQVLNGSFEINSNPGLADCWGGGGWGLRTLEEINNPEEFRQRLCVDSSVGVDGSRSFRISNPAGKKPLSVFSTWINYPQFSAGRKGWCVSAFIKARPASQVKLELLDSQYNIISGKTFDVGEEWTLCSFGVKTQIPSVVIKISPSEGTDCWIDCVQFSKGATPEKWSPAVSDKTLMLPKVASREFVSDIVLGSKHPDAVEKVSTANNWVRVNNKAFFPYGAMMQFDIDPQFLRQLKQMGFNTVNFYARNLDQTRKFLDLAYHAGLRAIPWIRCKASEAPEMAKALKKHPALVTWLVVDEPPEPFAKNIVDLVASVRNSDSDRPLWVNYKTQEINRFMNKLPSLPGDIISSDWYPVADINYPAQPCDPANLIDKMVAKLRDSGKVTWFALQICGYAFMFQREPTPEEYEGMVYSSVIAGSKGLFFFQNIPWNARLMEAAGKIGAEIDSLTPALADGTPIEIKTSNSKVMTVAKRYQGDVYVFAVNTSANPGEAKIKIDGIGLGSKKVSVLFEGRSPTVADNNTLGDRFEGYQRHVYLIKQP